VQNSFTNVLFSNFDLGLKPDQIDFVELVGEATRIPISIQHITEVF
jgi:molecular chaperone DnaK (HSP70)